MFFLFFMLLSLKKLRFWGCCAGVAVPPMGSARGGSGSRVDTRQSTCMPRQISLNPQILRGTPWALTHFWNASYFIMEQGPKASSHRQKTKIKIMLECFSLRSSHLQLCGNGFIISLKRRHHSSLQLSKQLCVWRHGFHTKFQRAQHSGHSHRNK